MDGEQGRDQPASTAEAQWKRDTFYSIVDTIQASMKQRFEKNRSLLQVVCTVCTWPLPRPAKKIQDARALQADITPFCATYQLDVFRYAFE